MPDGFAFVQSVIRRGVEHGSRLVLNDRQVRLMESDPRPSSERVILGRDIVLSRDIDEVLNALCMVEIHPFIQMSNDFFKATTMAIEFVTVFCTCNEISKISLILI